MDPPPSYFLMSVPFPDSLAKLTNDLQRTLTQPLCPQPTPTSFNKFGGVIRASPRKGVQTE